MKVFTDRLPTLDREERKALLERVSAGTGSDSDYHVMMILSSGLASLGLLTGFAAAA